MTKLPNLATPVKVAKNVKHSFYIKCDASKLRYTNGVSEGRVFKQDANIQFMEGAGVSGSFGRVYKPRVFNGCIHYTAASSGSGSGTGSKSLTTTMASNNGSAGNQFDIRAKNKVRIKGFDVNLKPGTHYVEVFGKAGTYDGSESKPNDWYWIQSATVTSQEADVMTPLPDIDTNFEVWPGFTQAFYIKVNSNSIRYTNGGNLGGVYAEDANLQFFEGAGVSNGSNNAGFGRAYEPRVWNGSIRYEVIP
jgi:hypothetical protein